DGAAKVGVLVQVQPGEAGVDFQFRFPDDAGDGEGGKQHFLRQPQPVKRQGESKVEGVSLPVHHIAAEACECNGGCGAKPGDQGGYLPVPGEKYPCACQYGGQKQGIEYFYYHQDSCV